jgi:hypothetical protein
LVIYQLCRDCDRWERPGHWKKALTMSCIDPKPGNDRLTRGSAVAALARRSAWASGDARHDFFSWLFAQRPQAIQVSDKNKSCRVAPVEARIDRSILGAP